MAKTKSWKEGELVLTFNLERITSYQTPLLKEWLHAELPILTNAEQSLFDFVYMQAVDKIAGWSEEDLKMKFISFILNLGKMTDEGRIVTFFDKKLLGVVEGITLSVKSDFMMAKGFMNVYQTPYFHFQEYKPQINPTGEPMGQLLEAFLIAQEQNRQAGKEIALYGCEVIGKHWSFVTMEQKSYCVSKSFDCTDKDDLLKIIGILRKFKKTLETRLLDL